MFTRTLLSSVLLLIASAGLVDAKTVRLLSVGNSFSQNATRHLDGLVKAGGHELIHTPIVVGGASMELHSEKARRHAADPHDPEGLYRNGRSLVQELQSQVWDAVTIQQASIKSHDINTYRPYAQRLSDLIRQHAPQAQLYVHQTWAYRVDDPRFSRPKEGEPATQQEMYEGLTHAYTTIAKELNARLLPVGDAFWLADNDPRWKYRPDTAFDFKTATQPALPDQTHSLHTGWQWKKQKGSDQITLSMDGHHANLAGEYLGACVWYEVLFGESAVGNTFIPDTLAPEYARFLQQTAHTAVQRSAGRTSASVVPPLKNMVAFRDFQEPADDVLGDGGADGADFTGGAAHRGGEWGHFFGSQIGGLAVFNRALDDASLAQLAAPLPVKGS